MNNGCCINRIHGFGGPVIRAGELLLETICRE